MVARLYAKRLRVKTYWWDDWLLIASWGGFGDGIVDSVPDEGVVEMDREDYIEKRLDAVEVEVARVSIQSNKSTEI